MFISSIFSSEWAALDSMLWQLPQNNLIISLWLPEMCPSCSFYDQVNICQIREQWEFTASYKHCPFFQKYAPDQTIPT